MEVSGWVHASAALTQARTLGVHWIGGRLDFCIGLKATSKRKYPYP